jgi:hypothetical protein
VQSKPYSQNDRTALNADATGGLGEIHIFHPSRTFALTPASRIAIQAIGNCQHPLAGSGLDWGSGTGCLAISYQYGRQRVEGLSQRIPGFSYGGVLASTDWVPFDLQRPDLLHCLELYAEEERRGGLHYVFLHPEIPDVYLNAPRAAPSERRRSEFLDMTLK